MNKTNDTGSGKDTLVSGYNRLGFRLLSELVTPDSSENVFLSSFSIAMALAMTYNGAEGETRQAMAELLGITGLDLEEVNRANAGFMAMQEGVDPGVQLAVANSIWSGTGAEPDPGFVDRLRRFYDGEARNLDFKAPGAADVINQWVSGKTKEKIKELVTEGQIKTAILVLINAITFKGTWTNRFDEKKTMDKTFTLQDGTRKQHPMMWKSGEYDYFENESCQAISLPYGEGRMSMVVFLPKPGVSAGKFRKMLSLKNWQKWMAGFYGMQGLIVLPRFKVEYGEDLLPHLVELGGGALADEDFLGMGVGPLIISSVIHKVFMEVNEEGAEAAAATAVVMARGSSSTFSMVVDRPFFCAICDNLTGMLLFMGMVNDPTQS